MHEPNTRRTLVLGLATVLVSAAVAFGWWDTIVKKWKYPPLVESYEAEGLTDKSVTSDELAHSGKAVAMTQKGPSLVLTRELDASSYGVYIWARSPRAEDVGDPGGMRPVYFRLSIANAATGKSESYRIRAAYQHVYPLYYGPEDVARCFFVAPVKGRYRIEIAVGGGSTGAPLLVDRIELRDILGNCAGKRGKTQRTMISDDELKNLRGGPLKPVAALPAEEVIARCRAYWASFPPPNAPRQGSANPAHYREKDRVPKPEALRAWAMNELDEPWMLLERKKGLKYTLADVKAGRGISDPFIDDGWGMTVTGLTHTWGEPKPVGGTFSIIAPLFQKRLTQLVGLMKKKAEEFEKTGDPKAGLEGTAILLALAWNYPLLDYRTQAAWPGNYSRFYFTNHIGGGIVGRGLPEGHAVRAYVRTYDRLFDFIKANPALADFLGTKVPGVRTIDDVVRFLDANFLQRTADVIMRGDVAGDPLKMSRALTMAAICQGANDISQKWVDTMFREIPMGMIEPGGLVDMAWSNLGRDGLVSKGSGGYSKGSIMAFLEIFVLLRRYRELGGNVPGDLTDVRKYPWFAQALYAPINLRTAGGWVPLIGDYGDPLRTREVYFDRGPRHSGNFGAKPYYLEAWRLTGDPAFAYLAARYAKRTTESPAEWTRLGEEATKTRDPLNIVPPRALDDFGLAILETGQEFDDYTKKRAVTLRYGHGHTHGHNDGLSMSVFGKGMRAISDLAARRGSPSPRSQKMHSTVEVDRSGMNNGDPLAAGYGWLNAFAPFKGVQYVNAGQRARSHPQLKVYRRGVALIDVGNEDSYIFNTFRVAGGKVHTWCAHANQNDSFEVNAELKPAASGEARAYLGGFKTPQTKFDARYMLKDLLPQPVEGAAPDSLTATWRLHPRAVKRFLYKDLPDDQRVFARWRLFGHGGNALYAANGTSSRYRYDMTFLYVQAKDAPPEGNVFPALAEVYQGQPVVQSARLLKVENAGAGASACVALAVDLGGGLSDVCLSGPGDGVSRKVESGIEFDGTFGFVRRDAQGVARAVLVGGRRLATGDLSIELPAGAITGEVVATDPARNTCVVMGNLEGAQLAGRIVHFVAPNGYKYAYTVARAEPAAGEVRLHLKERLKIFQSAVARVDAASGEISLVAEPYNLKADQNAYSFTEAANESGNKRWPANIITNTRWMAVKTAVADADIPDANGDGRRTLALIGGPKDKDTSGKPILTMEVTRVDAAGGIIYFKTPAKPYDIGGWNYVGRVMTGESGKKWKATYPGIEYKVVVEGDLTPEDFDDADHDGRHVLSLYRFRPGFRMELPNAISLERTAPGRYVAESVTKATVRAQGEVKFRSRD